MLHNFEEQYKSYTVEELLQIVQSGKDYQPAALQAASIELQRRNVSAEELQDLQTQWFSEHLQAVEKSSRSFEKQFAIFIQRTKAALNPFAKTGAERSIGFVFITVMVFWVYNILKHFSFFTYGVSLRFLALWLFMLAPYLCLPLGASLLYQQKRAGWILLCAWATSECLNWIRIIILYNMPKYYRFWILSPLTLIFYACFFGGMFYALNRKDIKEACAVSIRWQLLAIAIGCMYTGLALILF